MTTTEVSSLVKQYREAQQLAEMAKAEAEAAKAALLDELNRRGVDRLDAGTYKVTVTTVTSSGKRTCTRACIRQQGANREV